jgi:hypothetical protein
MNGAISGWQGDVVSQEGYQHLYLAPSPESGPAIINQTMSQLVVGATYVVRFYVGARTTPNYGAYLKLTISEQPDSLWDWATKLPSITIDEVKSAPGAPFGLIETVPFTAYEKAYSLELMSDVPTAMSPPGERLIFIDDFQ